MLEKVRHHRAVQISDARPDNPAEDIVDQEETSSGLPFLKPSRLFLFMEGRALIEAGSFLASWPLLAQNKRGDGRPVLLLPGFMAGDGSMILIKQFLRQMGYAASGWRQGRNMGPTPDLLNPLVEQLRRLYEKEDRKVALIGQSLGGVYARELARLHPEMVSKVITLGSPFRMPSTAGVSELVREDVEIDAEFEALRKHMASPPPVPVTALYSRSDGIVPWQTCIESPGESRESIEIFSSHIGMAVNPGAITVILDRLALPHGVWRPYTPGGIMSLWFPLRNNS